MRNLILGASLALNAILWTYVYDHHTKYHQELEEQNPSQSDFEKDFEKAVSDLERLLDGEEK